MRSRVIWLVRRYKHIRDIHKTFMSLGYADEILLYHWVWQWTLSRPAVYYAVKSGPNNESTSDPLLHLK